MELKYKDKVLASSNAPTYSAGEGITIDGDTININSPVQGIYTQEEFDLLSDEEKSKGLYVIEGEENPDDSFSVSEEEFLQLNNQVDKIEKNSDAVLDSMYQPPTQTEYTTKGNFSYSGTGNVLDASLEELLGDKLPDNLSFVLNDVTIGTYTEESMLSDVLRDINGNAEASVEASYSQETQDFLFVYEKFGAGHDIYMGDGLADILFGPPAPEGGTPTFANAYDFSWMEAEDTVTVALRTPSMSGALYFSFNGVETIEDIAKKLNRTLSSRGLTASYNRYTGQMEIRNEAGEPVEFSMYDENDWDIYFDESYAPSGITYLNGKNGIFTNILVNGEALTVDGKQVRVNLPTRVSQFTNDAGYQTKEEVESAVESATSSEVYSTEETRIGTWIDGKPLYRRVWTTGPIEIQTSSNYTLDSDFTSYKYNVVEFSGSSNGGSNTIPYIAISGTNVTIVIPQITDVGLKLRAIRNTSTVGNVGSSYTLIVKYTKTTD